MPFDKFSAAAMKDLHHALGGMISQHRQLFDVGAKHGLDLSKYMFGTIVWNKSLGKPSGAKPSDGFIVRIRATRVVLGGDAQGGPAQDYPPYFDSYPAKWDDSDAEQYLVHFLESIPSATRLEVHVTIVDGVTWVDEAGNPGREGHFMSPSVRSYGKDNPMPNWIAPFRVVGSITLEVARPA
jgi:hypothetical protein